MELVCLGSSSEGNCYLLRSSDGCTLVIECGVRMREVKRAMDWQIRDIAGCLVSHQHDDHAGYIKDFESCGIRVLALPEVFSMHNLKDSIFCKAIQPRHGYKVGDFKIYTVPVLHDVPCLGFVIDHHEMGKLLFVTDTMMLPHKISGLNHVMIEANYSDKILDYNIEHGIKNAAMRNRLLKSHMELETTANVLRANDLTDVNEIILLHLSQDNADPHEFKTYIEEVCGKPVYIARNTFKINLSIIPY